MSIEEIKALIDDGELDKARDQLEHKFKQNPNQVEVIDLLSEVYFDLDNTDGTIKMINKSITLDPNNNSDKYMTLAQLVDKPEKSVKAYEKAIEILKDRLEHDPNSKSIKEDLASAYASIGEKYMTTYLCDDPNAESICEQSILKGLEYDPESIDALMQMSNLRIIRKRDTEAKEYMDKIFQKLNSMKIDSEDFPDADVIFNLAKNYQEIGEFYTATKILDVLIRLDDLNLEYWYYLAFSHFQCENYQLSMKCLKRLQKAYDKVIVNGKNDLINDIESAAKELYDKLSSMGELTNKIEEEVSEEEKMGD